MTYTESQNPFVAKLQQAAQQVKLSNEERNTWTVLDEIQWNLDCLRNDDFCMSNERKMSLDEKQQNCAWRIARNLAIALGELHQPTTGYAHHAFTKFPELKEKLIKISQLV